MRVIHSDRASEIALLVEGPGLPHFNPADFETERADVHLSALWEGGDIQARCSLWWAHVPAYKQQRVGVIGHYAAASDDAAAPVLAAAQVRLREAGSPLTTFRRKAAPWMAPRTFNRGAIDHAVPCG